MSSPTTIESDTIIDDFDRHFRVLAGPGAGKTYWLVRHIRNVIKRSRRLPPPSRIACISYTTVAAEEIRGRLEEAADRVEVSTIHSFLYKNLVKPFLHLVCDEGGTPLVNFSRVDGHDEHRPTKGMLELWIRVDNSVRYLRDDPGLALKYLSQLTWRLEADGELRLSYRRHLGEFRSGRKKYQFPINRALQYKKLNWDLGRLHHEDVLYFAYRIASEFLDIGEFLASKFPYIYLDEFQDTNPIQTKLVSWLAAYGSYVGVIGDPAQSIYAFQEARREDFVEFELPGQADYVIEGNRRSTGHIIRLLNSVRGGDVHQKCIRGEEGAAPRLLVGTVVEAMKAAGAAEPAGSEGDSDNGLVILSRTNEGVGRIRNPDLAVGMMAWDELNAADSERHRFLHRVITAGEFAAQGSFERACKEILKCFSTSSGGLRDPLRYAGFLSDIEKRGVAVGLLEMLITQRPQLMSGSLNDFYLKLSQTLSDLRPGLELKPIKKGAIKEVAGRLTYRDLKCGVSLIEERRLIRTIHSAKGLEFTGILVCLEEGDLRHIISPNIDDEECRIMYVAMSRAINHLFMSVPSISTEDETRLADMGIEIIRCANMGHQN